PLTLAAKPTGLDTCNPLLARHLRQPTQPFGGSLG
ncbi:MAG: hypothetical protein RL385_5531, partial [Pseudomonadota bacterium]